MLTLSWRAAWVIIALAALLALGLPRLAVAYDRSPTLEAFATKFAMRPAEVRCSTAAEWTNLTAPYFTNPEDVHGVTEMFHDWIMLRNGLCEAAEGVADESIPQSRRAIAVLALTHEAYHVRRWAWRRDEARVECQAIRHFVVAARLLGASLSQARSLLPYARQWHKGIARKGTAYFMLGCKTP